MRTTSRENDTLRKAESGGNLTDAEMEQIYNLAPRLWRRSEQLTSILRKIAEGTLGADQSRNLAKRALNPSQGNSHE